MNFLKMQQRYLSKSWLRFSKYTWRNFKRRLIDTCPKMSIFSWVSNRFDLDVQEIGNYVDGCQEELDPQWNQVLREKFAQVAWSQFSEQLRDEPVLSHEAEKALLPFPTTYLCEAGFSSPIVIKTRERNRLDPEHDLHCALSINVQPRITELIKCSIEGSHWILKDF